MRHGLLIICLFFSELSIAQNYKLIPDSCTFCTYKWSDGSTNLTAENYHIDPSQDTALFGNTYKRVLYTNSYIGPQPFAVRQVGDRVYGVLNDSLQEYLIMDFEAIVGDTIYGLYSDGYFYDAVVVSKDSTLLSGSAYHHWMELQGDTIYGSPLVGGTIPWSFRWEERGLCNLEWLALNEPYGGYAFNLPVNNFSISLQYAYVYNCTTDSLYSNSFGLTCNLCALGTNGTEELELGDRKIIKVVDSMGRETEDIPNTFLIYQYSDGTSEKVFRVE